MFLGLRHCFLNLRRASGELTNLLNFEYITYYGFKLGGSKPNGYFVAKKPIIKFNHGNSQLNQILSATNRSLLNQLIGSIIYQKAMLYAQEIHVGIFKVQAGFRNNTGLIQCPYLTDRIEVENAPALKVLDGATVYWQQIRRFRVNRKSPDRQETVIVANVLSVASCRYISEGTNIICTVRFRESSTGCSVLGKPLNKKLPTLQIVDLYGNPATYQSAFPSWEQMTNYYYRVQILCWNSEDEYPKAYIVDQFSSVKTAEAEAEAILYTLDIDHRKLELDVEKLSQSSTYLPIKNHEPFDELVFSIDPKESIDMEDALSLKEIGDGVYEIGVHISDVSSFMDLVNRKQIYTKGCSIYLPHRTIHMFPQEIIQMCSFEQKKQRLAFSVFFTMDESGQIKSTTFKKTIIVNCAQMNYAEAQEVIDGSISMDKFRGSHQLTYREAEDIVSKIKILKKIAFERRKIRKSQEVLDRNEVTFELDKDNIPIAVGIKKRFDSERLVEEFMIAANGEVARKLVNEYGPNALLIHHPRPTEYSINNLNSFVSDFGVCFKIDSIMGFEREMKKLFEKEGIKDQFKEALLMRAIQIQQMATYTRYNNTQGGHYGLNMDYYTHFTSPLRRFSDIVVHEQLNRCLNCNVKQKHDSQLGEEIQHMNKARGRNKKLKQLVVECFLNLYLHKKGVTLSAKALIMSLGLKSATLYIPLYNIVKEVPWSKSVQSTGRECVSVKGPDQQDYSIGKNDSIDVQISADVHQEVKVSMRLKDNTDHYFKL